MNIHSLYTCTYKNIYFQVVHNETKKQNSYVQEISTTVGPTERTPKPEYLIARLQLTERGPLVRSHSIFDGLCLNGDASYIIPSYGYSFVILYIYIFPGCTKPPSIILPSQKKVLKKTFEL